MVVGVGGRKGKLNHDDCLISSADVSDGVS